MQARILPAIRALSLLPLLLVAGCRSGLATGAAPSQAPLARRLDFTA
ncbi:MAG TPA: hypothetical protein VES73_13190 [Lamprocystis sp. (in: g-proteobacteria)]|nr:hypothetical protein [Lamprocystis sp. (in: g-proteobacteria)]